MTARHGVLFDLDGTLVDTAPDLIACLQGLLAEAGRTPAPSAALQATVSHGARIMVSHAFSLPPSDPHAVALEQELVRRYRARIADESRLFPGMASVLDTLEAQGIPWGIVTNKPTDLTEPLLERLGLDTRAGAVVCGDTLARAKPHPDPIRHAAATLGCPPEACWSLGDARRDIDAAAAAGARGLVALFGYLHAGDRPALWGAHGLIRQPAELLGWIDPGLNARLEPSTA
ncbi:HAD-IA family hydrolase [Halorhodospira halophila]|uniref:Phosphoglycolate phosphatase n=1 Tax=Halorhodospira halophila (strain DSM 244 / SL1) TaxID=349124 RepID=A1WUK0_HALHL|nr:HAD-IA family hydrolase [Halorhodospira halophila]ABM61362.1 phosphoglycolate phosphatase [Halorhodospira halophila SL1]MBK1729055.1 phosphoglycolate phosphatase [Halorhodospira halophila]